MIQRRGYAVRTGAQLTLLKGINVSDTTIYCAGDLDLFDKTSVAIVGARDASQKGLHRAYILAKELSHHGLVIVSGLARGVDAAAHYGAIDNAGRTIAVIGTPLDKATPAENAVLQERIYREHLLVSPFAVGESTYKSSFPKRNRVMALLSDATVIVEASDTSGTLHQASECLVQGRWLFILKSVTENPAVTWPARFVSNPKTIIVSKTEDILSRIVRG